MFKVRSVLSLILWLTCTCSTAYAGESVRNPPADSIAMAARIDSVRQLRANDVAFILDKKNRSQKLKYGLCLREKQIPL